MNTSLASKLHCIFFIFAILFNPVSVLADVMFVEYSGQNHPVSDEQDISVCHDDNVSNNDQIIEQLNCEVGGCCESPCSCGESGCHASLALVGSSNSKFISALSAFRFQLKHYISFSSSPGSPPPIV